MIEVGNCKNIINCPGCNKEYNMDEYKKLKKAKPKLIMSVHGKKAPKEALTEISKLTSGILHKEHVDIFNNEIYDPRICSECGTEFGFVKIVDYDNDNTIYRIDLDLIKTKD